MCTILVNRLTLITNNQTYDSWLILVRFNMTFLQANCGDPDQTPLSVASALRLYCLPAPKYWTVSNKLSFQQANCGDPDQMPLTVASALGLHYLHTLENWTRLILVRCKLIFLQANCGVTDQTSLTVASALGLHYLLTAKNWTLGLYW